MGNLLSDVRYCLRGFARRPLFAVVVVATLALGLSVNAAIFSIYDQVLLRELPVPEPRRARESRARPGPKQGNTSCNDGGTCDEIFSYPMFRDLERVDGPFVGIAAHRYIGREPRVRGRDGHGQRLARVRAAISRCSAFSPPPVACSMPTTIASTARRAPSC